MEMVAQVYTEFTELVKIFTNSTYDPMELTAKVNRWPATVVQGGVKYWGSDCTSKLIDVQKTSQDLKMKSGLYLRCRKSLNGV